ncbi:DUF2625 family protein [Streptomyces mirabilis]|uniref:DUF2625 family protein n=1 Tax=Streptomyces mirabilis TaxID=68239 RepID=UPI0036BDB646
MLSPDSGLGGASLLPSQVTARSYLGAMVLHRGGLLVDDGWLRVFGPPPVDRAAHGVPSLARLNQFPGTFAPAWRAGTGLVVAHDVLGGVFALNGEDPVGAGRPGVLREVVYFAPDSLRCEALGVGHSAWMAWPASGAGGDFSADLRWPGLQDEVRVLNGDQGLSMFPPLWPAEARQALSEASRRAGPKPDAGVTWHPPRRTSMGFPVSPHD